MAEKKQTKKRSSRDDDDDDDTLRNDDAIASGEGTKKAKKPKKDKKDKKIHDNHHDHDDSPMDENKPDKETTTTTTTTTSNPQDKRSAKKAEKLKLLEQVPKVDSDGIAYTKLQLRRMIKRVKRGLAPVPTEEEERQRRREEAQTRQEEEAELAGLLYNPREDLAKSNPDQDSDDEGVEDGDDNENQDGDDDDDSQDGGDEENHTEEQPDSIKRKTEQHTVEARKRTKRAKPVPQDYVCQACHNKHQPVHWIYDCPNKVTVKGTNQISKRLRGIHDPDGKKVFVSGLPFDMKRPDVELLFQGCGKISTCKLLTFPDTGRCKGQAYITFDTDVSAKNALKLSGKRLENQDPKDDKKSSKKTKQKTEPVKRKELRLKVTNVLNRAETKKPASK